MRYVVPQFIEYEAKIVGPFTFRQFIYIAMSGAVCFILYFSVDLPVFLAATFLIMGTAAAFAFITIGGRPLPTILANMIKFGLTSKMFLWKRREGKMNVYEKEVRIEKEEPKEKKFKLIKKSQLKSIRNAIETKTENIE